MVVSRAWDGEELHVQVVQSLYHLLVIVVYPSQLSVQSCAYRLVVYVVVSMVGE